MTGPKAATPWQPLGEPGEHFWLVQRMAKRCGSDLARAASEGQVTQEEWVEMVHKCRGCQWTEGCQRWLDQLVEDGTVDAPDQCLNAEKLKDMSSRHRES